MRERRIINATRVCHSICHPYMMQSSVCHFVGGEQRPSLPTDLLPSQQTLLHLTDSFGDNTINTDCDT